MRILKSILLAGLMLLFSCMKGEAQSGAKNTFSEFPKYTVFSAGDDNVNSYRIPSLLTAKDGSLIVFCEARRESWQDKSRTDIVVKRSTDNGQTWSVMQDLTKGTTGAYMDPTPILDSNTGKVFLFTTFWPAKDHSGAGNRAILITSDDNGQTWSTPADVTASLIPDGRYIYGFGPGAGLQMVGEKYKGRLILPARISDAERKTAHDVAIFSDNHGETWTVGGNGDTDNEFQIAESPNGVLVYNARVSGARMVAYSKDGGMTWSKAVKEPALPGVSKGCQASVLGKNAHLYFSGIKGIPETPEYDERAGLTLYKSCNGGKTWNDGLLLYDKASGYSCMALLPDGRMAIIFETADTQSFTRKSLPNIKPLKRPADWMKLDLILVPIINL
ncbi:sialidase family protein [Bacteroides faecium]|uniref:exo-alpha-sialidase n=1 Tax=Bacteroides faecium TaxID=2715212 RepID=A0A6H0KT06_9BACE|nr:sialidase family protein [Bacteroides faecium]QIU95628.1 exo-alpha-sialidase [Bacteroides faecium]